MLRHARQVGARTGQLTEVRLRASQGLGGRAIGDLSTVVVDDYLTDSTISSHFRPVVGCEELRGMAAVPLLGGHAPIGILYGARRSVGRPGDGIVDALQAVATSIAPVLAIALVAEQQVRRQLLKERQRIAGVLHDDIGSLLFAISAAARRARELATAGAPEVCGVVAQIEKHTRTASEGLRGLLRAMAPIEPGEAIAVAAQRDVDDFADRSGVCAHLVVQGVPAVLGPAVERTLLGCLRQALFNIERHAGASLVIATLDYQRPGWVTLAVQDDGQGRPPEFEPRPVPAGDRQWGFTSMLRQTGQLGGSVRLDGQDDGGAVLRVRLPVLTAA